MTPKQYCEEKAASSGSSFYYSFLFLPREQRDAITAIYAFCREVDDIVDESTDPDVARTTLAWWRSELAAAYDGNPQHPVARALQPVVTRFDIAQENLQEIIDGMEMDLEENRYPEFQDLRLYCHRVAGVVGLISASIFGYEDRATLRYAHDLGIAFQLTNILRDVGEDAARNRIYIPLDEMERFGVTEQDILDRRHTPGMSALFDFQAQRAREYYQRAFAELPEVDRFRQRSGVIMASIYMTVLDGIVESGFPVLERRVSLSPWRKLWLAWRTARRESSRHRRYRRSVR